jgi:hypothetical protein
VIQVLITIGILGVINGINAYTGKMYEQMISDRTLVFSESIVNKFGDRKKTTMFYVLTINILAFALATLIGCFFINTSIYKETDYSPTMCKLYSFVDLTAN